MKKIVALLLTVVLCLGLAACGKPKNNEPINEPVKITMDNWSEYFEFSSPYSVYYKEETSSNSIKEVNGITIDYYFSLKSKYSSKLDTKKSSVKVKISADIGTQMGAFSSDYSSFEPSGEFKGRSIVKEGSKFIATPHNSFALHITIASANDINIKVGKMSSYIKNQKVLNIEGTLYFAE